MCSGRYDADRERVFGSFGLLIVDECHHWAAPTLSKTMSRFPARCVLALSATPNRKDGLGFVLPYFFGPTVARVKRNSTGKLRVEIINVPSGKAREIRLRNGRTCLPKTITMMVEDPARNRMLAEKVVALHGEGRSVILMSDRRKHLVELRRVLVERGPEAVKLMVPCATSLFWFTTLIFFLLLLRYRLHIDALYKHGRIHEK